MPRKEWVEEIVFVQGDEGLACIDMLGTYGERTLFLHLLGLAGDAVQGNREQSLSPWGAGDYIATFPPGYILSYNLRLGYAGLCQRI